MRRFYIVNDRSVGTGELVLARTHKRSSSSAHQLPSDEVLGHLSNYVQCARDVNQALLGLDAMIAYFGIDRTDRRQGSVVVNHLVTHCPMLRQPEWFRRLVLPRLAWLSAEPCLDLAVDGSVTGCLVQYYDTLPLVEVLADIQWQWPAGKAPLPYSTIMCMADLHYRDNGRRRVRFEEMVDRIDWNASSSKEIQSLASFLAFKITIGRKVKQKWFAVLRWCHKHHWQLRDEVFVAIFKQIAAAPEPARSDLIGLVTKIASVREPSVLLSPSMRRAAANRGIKIPMVFTLMSGK